MRSIHVVACRRSKRTAAKKREQVSTLRIVLKATFRGSHCSFSVIEEMNLQHHHTDSPEFEDGSEVIELRIVIKATCGFEAATLRSMKLTVNPEVLDFFRKRVQAPREVWVLCSIAAVN
jgi:hypothetical protein